jgi:hypothetical protein
MLRTEAMLKEFWSEEASRKLRIALIHKDVQLYQQQHKMKRILQSQSIAVESSKCTSSAASSTSMSSQTESVNKTSKETQTDLHEEEQNEKSSAVNNLEDEEDKDTASEMATEETSNVVDESPLTSNADLAIETELICDGKQESQALAKEETKEQCPQDTDEEDQGADQEERESESKEASTPSITMDSPDFMSKIARRFKALDDDEFINETTASSQADVADEPMSKDDTSTECDVSIVGEDDAEDQNSDNAGDDDTNEAEMNAMSARPTTRTRIIKAGNKDKRKKRVTGGGTSTLYATFKPPQLKNNKRQRRRK